jgi:hypothetical protein
MLRAGILSLAAAAIVIAALAAGAPAAEVGECVKLAKVEGAFHGHYVDKNCQVAATPAEEAEGKHNKWVWSSGVAPANAPFRSRLGRAELTGPGGAIECADKQKAGAAGEWTGPKTGTETITFKGCEFKGGPVGDCHSAGQAAGTIVTNPLQIDLLGEGEESFNLTEEDEPEPRTVGAGEVWEQLRGPGGELGSVAMEYECASIIVIRTEGSLAGPIPAGALNARVKKYEVGFGEGKGAQGQFAEASISGEPFFPVGKGTITGVLDHRGAGKVEFRP